MSEPDGAAWDVYSATKRQRRQTNNRGETTWFNWTQYADHGPGAEVLSLKPGETALDLGCGSGGNAAHLAALGMRAVGVDLSSRQLRHVPAASCGRLLWLSGVLHLSWPRRGSCDRQTLGLRTRHVVRSPRRTRVP
ncbi:methyltransferase domain-containing protein [Streptomyces sp. NPDC032161]|uniref:SAM-dependent methyltransferase n=1 Tax=unclassified Streptomyces TaxID=2593676 RepID=UPI0033D07636